MKSFLLFFLISVFAVFVNIENINAQCPTANFTFNKNAQCTQTTISFTNTSIASNQATYKWLLGNGQVETSSAPTTQVYTPIANDTTIQVTLIVADITCNDTITQNIRIITNVSPNAVFSVPSTQCAPVNFVFNGTNSSAGNVTGLTITNYNWTINTTSHTTSTVNRTFNPIGSGTQNYAASLVVTNSIGCTNTSNQSFNVKERPDASLIDPLNNFKSCDGYSLHTLEVYYNGTTSSNNNGYSVNWGYGNASDVFPAGNIFSSVTHNYTTSGIFPVILTIQGINGCNHASVDTLFNISNPAVNVSSFGNTTGCADLELCFSIGDSVDLINNDASTIYLIDFGDNTPIASYNHPPPDTLCHNYTESSCGKPSTPPSFPADAFIFTVVAKNGCDDTPGSVGNIKVFTGPEVEFTYVSEPGCVNNTITFTNTTQEGLNNTCSASTIYKWNFGDSPGITTVFTNATQTHTYNSPGQYIVTLTGQNSCGIFEYKDTICITPMPIATFDVGANTLSDIMGCVPFTINNIINTSNTVTGSCFETYEWNISTVSNNCANSSNPASWTFIGGTSDTSETPQIRFDEPGTYILELLIDNTCPGTSSFTRTIIVQDEPNIVLANIPVVCEQATFTPTLSIFNNCYAPITNWVWSTQNGTIEFPNQQIPGTVSFNSSGSQLIQVSAQNTCGTVVTSTTVIVNDLPTPPTLTVNTPCVGQFISITTSGGTANTGYSWDFPDDNNTYSLINITRFGATTAMQGSYILTITDQNNCFDTTSIYVPVYPLPNVMVTATNTTPCLNTPVTLTATGATSYVWQQQSQNTNTLSVNPTQNTNYAVVGTDGHGCKNGANININPIALPIVYEGSDTIVCTQNPPIPIQLTGTQNTGNPNDGTWSVLGNIGTNSITSNGLFTPNNMTINNIQLVYTYQNTTTTCENYDTIEVQVILPDIASAGNDITVCEGSQVINLVGNYSNTGTWRALGSSQAITTFNPTTAGTFYFVYTLGIESCINHDTMKITVNPLPIINITTSDQTPCVFSPITLTASGALTYDWQLQGGNDTNNPLQINPTQDSTYQVIGTDAKGCVSNESIFINTIDLPIVNAGQNTVVCYQIPAIPVQLTGTQNTGNPNSGTWSAGNIAPNTISTNGTFTPNDTASNIQLVYTYTNSNTGCTNTDTMEIDVIFPDTASAGDDIAVCQGSATLTLGGNNPNGVWTDASNNTITQFNPNTAGTFQLTYTIGAGSCISQDTMTITVNPLPIVSVQNDFSICRNEPILNLTENISGGTWSGTGITDVTTGEFNPSLVTANSTILNYTYTDGNTCTNHDNLTITIKNVTEAIAGDNISFCNITDDIQLTGFSPTTNGTGTWSGTGMQNNAQGIFNSNGVSTTYEVYYTFVNNNNCTDTDTLAITVNNLVKPTLQNDTAVCINTDDLTLTETPSGGILTKNGATFSNPFTPNQSGVYEFIYTIESGTTCESSDTLEIRVEALPQITLSNDLSACADTSLIDLSEMPSGGIWSGTGITDAANGIFDVSNSTQTVTYTYIETQFFYDDTLQCSNNDNVTITVNLLPNVSVQDTISYCLVSYSITLPTGTPLNGTWSGTGITAPDLFNPTNAGGIGAYTATYTFIDGNGCEDSDNMHIRVEASDSVSAGFSDTICITEQAALLTDFYPITGGTWSGTGITNASTGMYNPVQAGAGIDTLTFTYGNGTCQISVDKIRLVVDTTIINAGIDQTACLNELAFQLTGFTPTGGFWTGTGVDSSGMFTPLSVNSFLLKYTFIEEINGCISEDYRTITINPLPVPEAGLDTILCSVNDTISLPNGTANVTGNGLWTGSNGIIDNTNLAFSVNPSIIGVSTIPLYFTFTDTYNCSVTDSIELEIISPVAIDAGLADSVCFDTGLDTLVGFPEGGIWTGTSITNDSIFNSNINPNVYTLTYTYNDGNGGCLVSDTRQRTVRDLPVVNAGNDEIRCLNEPPFQLQNYSPQGGIWSGTDVNSNGLFTPTNTGTFTLTYTYLDFFGCENSDTKTITIHPLPIVEAQGDTTLCAVNTIITLPNGTGNVAGNGVWTGSNAIIQNTNLSVNPSVIGANNSAILYFTFEDNFNCSVIDSMELFVIASDSINAGMSDTVCLNYGLDTLVGYPAGGVWSGMGIIQDRIFNNTNNNTPSGIYTLTYTFDNGNGGCEVTDTRTRTVRALPVMIAALDSLVCIEAPAFTMFGFSPITDLLGTGMWTGNGITNENLGIFESDTAGIGQHILTYTYTDFFGCINSNNRIIDVVNLPIIDSLIGLDTLCNQPFGVQYIGYQNSGNPNDGVWSGQNMATDGKFTPNGVGDFMVYYCYEDNNTCERCDSMVITVVPAEPIDAGIADTICIDEGIHLLTAEFPNDGYWSGSLAILDSIVGNFDPLIATGGWHTVTYKYGEGTCFVSDTTGVYVRDLAFVDAGADENACETDANFAISGFSPTGGVWSGNGVVNSSGIFSPTAVTPGTYPIKYLYTDSITGCDTSRIKNVFIHHLAAPDFSFDTILCINVPYTISDLSTNTTQWFWDFGDGTTYATQNPTHTYTTTGNYTIKLIAKSVHGCKDSTTLTVFVTEIPTASFTKDTTNGCTPLPVNFTNTSTGDLMTYSWNLGNSSFFITTLNPPTMTYTDGTQDTTYYITLTTTNLCGSNDFTDSVLVYPKPQIFFTPDVNSGCTPLTVDFYNNTLGNPDAFYWNYGDGNLDTLTNQNTQSHIFYTDTTPTIYHIVLIAENECGLDTADVNITVNPVTVESFFNASTTTGCQPLTVNFANYSTPGTTVIWNFGDGSSSDTINSTSHTFQQAGTFKVIQYVTNGCGYDSTFVLVNVLPAPTASFISQNNICEDLPLTFTNTSVNTIGQTWDFGDGTTSTDSVATHTYTTAGTYQVTLTAFNNVSQCSASIAQTITILPKPIAIFTPSVTTGCEDLVIQFTNSSIGNVTGYGYDFGDNNSSSNPSPTHTYTDSGSYVVSYFVVDANTCVSDVFTQNIQVYPIPTSNFAFAILDSCQIPTQVAFTNLSQGATGYEWTVDNSSNFLTTNNPTVTYQNDGIYNINLKAINIYGCQDSSQQTFELVTPPVAVWNVTQPNSCLPSEVFFTNNSLGNGLNHFYNFGDNSTTTTPSPTHIFTNVGTYNSTYFVTDMNGCSSDTLNETINVFPVPTSNFSFEILDSCTIPTLVAFTNLSQGATNYEWRLDNGQILGNVSPTTYYNQEGIYTIELVAENSYSCRDSSQQTFEIYAPPTGFVTYEQLDTCEPSLVQFYPNALNTTDYFWNFGNGQTSTAAEPIATYQNVGIYDVKLTLGVNSNCFDTLTYNDFVQVFPRPFANFAYLDTMIDGRFKGVVKFYNTSIGANQYSWDFGDNTTSNLENPLHAFQSNGLFDVELIAINSYNCADDTIISVRPDFFGTLEVPNIMAPGFGTGEDRFFIPKGIGLETYLVEVFDKQGTRIWLSDEIDADGRPTGKWDGTYQDKDLPQGAYVWKIKAQFVNGTTVHRTGTVTIVR